MKLLTWLENGPGCELYGAVKYGSWEFDEFWMKGKEVAPAWNIP